jgi:hypothetical protein
VALQSDREQAMANFKALNIYGHHTNTLSDAAKMTTITGRISRMEITRIHCLKMPQPEQCVGEKIAAIDEGSGAAHYH